MVKRSKCDVCDEKFEGSTSRHIKKLQAEHWRGTGHRRYIGIIGFGNFTFDPHPDHPDVSQERQAKWVPEEPEPQEENDMELATAVTQEELEAALKAHPTHKELVAWKKELLTKADLERKATELQHIITGIEQSIQAGAYGDVDPAALKKLRGEVMEAFGKAKAEIDRVEQRIDGIQSVTKRFKEMAKTGFHDPRFDGLSKSVEQNVEDTEQAIDLLKEASERVRHVQEHVADLNKDTKDLFARTASLESKLKVMDTIEKVDGIRETPGFETGNFLMDAKGEKCYVLSHIGPARKGDTVASVASGGEFIASVCQKPTNKMRIHLKEVLDA